MSTTDLSGCRTFDQLRDTTMTAARWLAGADGVTFVLRDGQRCFYVDEDAIAPLWKGQRFPITECISGWAMRHGEQAVVSDVRSDERIPIAAYRPTFVRSLVMTPMQGVGAFGVYWARPAHAVSAGVLGQLRELGAEAGRQAARLDPRSAPWAPTLSAAT